MRKNSVPDERVREFLDLLEGIGRRNSLRDPMSQLVEQTELGPAQVHAVMWLHRDGPLAMSVLAQRIGVNQKTMTGVVDRLERQGYAERARGTGDRRVVEVVLTKKGKVLGDQLARGVFANVRVLLELLDDRDRKDLFRIVQNILHSIEQRAPAGEPLPD